MKHGSGSAWVTPSTVTWRSSIGSSSAACVRGDARFTSSTSTTFANTGPGRKSQLPVARRVHRRAGEVGRQEVGGALDPAEAPADRRGQALAEQRLAGSGHVLDEQVAARRAGRRARGAPLRPCPGSRPRPSRTAPRRRSGAVDRRPSRRPRAGSSTSDGRRRRSGGRGLHGRTPSYEALRGRRAAHRPARPGGRSARCRAGTGPAGDRRRRSRRARSPR